MSEETKKMVNEVSERMMVYMGIIIIFLAVGIFTKGFGLIGGGQVGKTLDIDGSPVLGESDAPVTAYIFTDFSCPFCAAANGENPAIIAQLKAGDPLWSAPIPSLIKNYVKTGKVKLVFKYTPGHGSGQPAHRVAWCLEEQELFWEFHDAAFAHQSEVSDMVKMKALAQSLGADIDKVNTCLSAGTYDWHLENDTAMGEENGVKGTPAFFVNGKLIEGAVSYSDLKVLVEKALR